MSERLRGFIVTLEDDLLRQGDDLANHTLNALRMVKGVLSVEPIRGESEAYHLAYEQVRKQFSDQLWRVLYPPTFPFREKS